MSGIVGYIGNKRVVPVLLEGLQRLQYRGYDSAGIAVIQGRDLQVRRATGKLHNLEEAVRLNPVDGTYGVGHTRWATHGAPTEENAHPHRDCNGTVVVVHNGIIENYLELKKGLVAEGHKFATEVDTEIIAHLVEKYLQGNGGAAGVSNSNNLEEAVRAAVRQLRGVFALAFISTRDPNKVDIRINDLLLCRDGMDAGFDEDSARKELDRKEISLRLDLHQGRASAHIWTCDLTHDYITINASYRT